MSPSQQMDSYIRQTSGTQIRRCPLNSGISDPPTRVMSFNCFEGFIPLENRITPNNAPVVLPPQKGPTSRVTYCTSATRDYILYHSILKLSCRTHPLIANGQKLALYTWNILHCLFKYEHVRLIPTINLQITPAYKVRNGNLLHLER